MADSCCEYEFAGLTINDAGEHADSLWVDPTGIVGLDGAPIRSQVDPRGQTHGGIVHPKWFAARVIRFPCVASIRSVTIEATDAYFAALNALEAAVVGALEAKLNSADTLTWTPTGRTQHTISCTYGTAGGEVQFSGTMLDRKCVFTLIAADPTITVA